MATIIRSNGSKWAGEEPDTVAQLLGVMAAHPLDRTFEDYGNFRDRVKGEPGRVIFFGNFRNLAHALTAAIRANRRRDDYTSQPRPGANRWAR